MNICLKCGKETDNPKFCSRGCSVSYYNSLRSSRTKHDYCLVCGSKVKKRGARTCSRECHKELLYLTFVEAWLAGDISGSRNSGRYSRTVRTYLLRTYNNQCQCCGWSEINPYTNTLPLEVHHIDGDWSNNRPENLQLLCPNCHALTSTHRGANALKFE